VRDEYIQGEGVRLHVVRAGEGPPVILLHGFPENWTSWRHQIPALADAGFSVWALDLRGYHLSERPAKRGAYHLRYLVEDVAAVVRATGAARVHLVGHDWGGVIAWAFAARHPELLDKLVILNAPHMEVYLRKVGRLPQMFRSWYVLFFQLPLLPEWALSARGFAALRGLFRTAPASRPFSTAEIEEYLEPLSRPGALTAALNYYRANLRPGALRFASSAPIAARTLVIWGELDGALGPELLEGLERVVPRVEIHRLPNAGHWVHNEAPEAVNGLLLRFLRSGTASER